MMAATMVLLVSMNMATLTRSSPNQIAAPGCYCTNGSWKGLAPPGAGRCFTIPTDEACARFGSPCPPSLLDAEPHLRAHLLTKPNGCREAFIRHGGPATPEVPSWVCEEPPGRRAGCFGPVEVMPPMPTVP